MKARQLIAAIIWGVQLSVWMTVPLLDVGIYLPGVVMYAHGERPGDYRDHDHDVCIQFFTNQAAPADAPVLDTVLAVIHLQGTEAAVWARSADVPSPSARDPPLL